MLNLAIPSKGRLKEKSEEWFAAAGYPIRQIGGSRGYQAQIDAVIYTHLTLPPISPV